jgi:glycine oxidase
MKIAIVGGGIIGLSSAVEAAENGLDVTLFEEKKIGSGATGAGTGLLIHHGVNAFKSHFRRFVVRSVCEVWPDWISRMESLSGCKSSYSTGTTFLAIPSEEHSVLLSSIEREFCNNIEELKFSDLNWDWLKESSKENHFFYKYHNESWVNNDLLINCLKKAAQNLGVKIFENEKVNELSYSSPVQVKTSKGCYVFDKIILSTGHQMLDLLKGIGWQATAVPVRGQALHISSLPGLDTVFQYGDLFHLVARGENKMALGATTDVGNSSDVPTKESSDFLEARFKTIIKPEYYEFRNHWAGIRMRSRDREPWIGPINGSENVWICGGFYKNGLAMAPLAAQSIIARILEQKAWISSEEFNPLRPKGLKIRKPREG